MSDKGGETLPRPAGKHRETTHLPLNALRSHLLTLLFSGSRNCTYQACLIVIQNFQHIFSFNYLVPFFFLRPRPDLLCSLAAVICEFCHTLEPRSSVSPHPGEGDETEGKM